MTLRLTSFAALVAVLLVTACEAPEPPAPPAPPSPPSPDLPMTAVKAREIVSGLPLTCVELASLKMDMVLCEERQGKSSDHAALRTQLRDLRWNLQSQPTEVATARCTAEMDTLRAQPKPQACWDLGIS